jgi:hypothetical protein
MSRYHGNEDECPVCGLKYRQLRTGYSYQDVFLMLWRGEDDPSEWVYKKRNTVLGKWHQIKQEMWSWHLRECTLPAEGEDEQCQDSMSPGSEATVETSPSTWATP